MLQEYEAVEQCVEQQTAWIPGEQSSPDVAGVARDSPLPLVGVRSMRSSPQSLRSLGCGAFVAYADDRSAPSSPTR